MSYNIQIIQARDFVRAKPKGTLDFAQSKKLLTEISATAGGLSDYSILLDIRRAEPELSVPDIWALAEQIHQNDKTYHRKTAVLCLLEQFEQAEFFALAAQNKGLPLGAFTSYEDAIEWLIA